MRHRALALLSFSQSSGTYTLNVTAADTLAALAHTLWPLVALKKDAVMNNITLMSTQLYFALACSWLLYSPFGSLCFGLLGEPMLISDEPSSPLMVAWYRMDCLLQPTPAH